MHIASAARAAARQIVDFALPPRCPSCGAVTQDAHRFCLDCWTSLTFLGEPCCEQCGAPFDYASGEGALCGACLAFPPAFDRLRAAVAYGPAARTVVLKLKYGGKPGVAETLARLMRRHLLDYPPDTMIAPVPLHRWRIWSRGYNQSALLAARLADQSGLKLRVDLLDRRKHTPVLKGLGRKERADAVRGAFQVSPTAKERIAGRTIVLVDDVFTTGATAGACAKALKRAKAARVDIICWARVVSEGED